MSTARRRSTLRNVLFMAGMPVIVGGVAGLACSAMASPGDEVQPTSGNPAHGALVYQNCMSCHSLDENDIGPRHRGVIGRRAGSVEGYAYSPALKNATVVWTAATIDRWLADPQAMVPGSKMFFALKNAQDRADVIAYLEQQQ